MKMIIKDDIMYLPYWYTDENDIESMFRKHADIIFGNFSLFFDGTKIKSNSNIGSIPDGFVVTLDDERWYVIEVELATHPLHEHIVPQISKFNTAIKNFDTRKKLIDAFYNVIQADIQLRNKFDFIESKKEIYKFLTDCINKKPEILIIIDEKTDELKEICESLPFASKVLEFKTYYTKNIGTNFYIYLFDTLKDYNGVPIKFEPSEPSKQLPEIKEIQPTQNKKPKVRLSELVKFDLIKERQKLIFCDKKGRKPYPEEYAFVEGNSLRYRDGNLYSPSDLAKELRYKLGLTKKKQETQGPIYLITENGRLLDDLNDEARKQTK